MGIGDRGQMKGDRGQGTDDRGQGTESQRHMMSHTMVYMCHCWWDAGEVNLPIALL